MSLKVCQTFASTLFKSCWSLLQAVMMLAPAIYITYRLSQLTLCAGQGMWEYAQLAQDLCNLHAPEVLTALLRKRLEEHSNCLHQRVCKSPHCSRCMMNAYLALLLGSRLSMLSTQKKTSWQSQAELHQQLLPQKCPQMRSPLQTSVSRLLVASRQLRVWRLLLATNMCLRMNGFHVIASPQSAGHGAADPGQTKASVLRLPSSVTHKLCTTQAAKASWEAAIGASAEPATTQINQAFADPCHMHYCASRLSTFSRASSSLIVNIGKSVPRAVTKVPCHECQARTARIFLLSAESKLASTSCC